MIKSYIDRLLGFFKIEQEGRGEYSKMRFFKEEGDAPLSEVNFDVKDVFEMDIRPFQTEEKALELYEFMLKLPYIYELYSIPTVVNFQKDIDEGRIEKEYKEFISNLKDVLGEEQYKYTRVFLITKRKDSEKITKELKKISFNMIGAITQEEAQEITVQ